MHQADTAIGGSLRGCLTPCVDLKSNVEGQYHDFDTLKRRLELEKELEDEDRCPPHVPLLPIGSIVAAIVAFPIAVCMWVWLDVVFIGQIASSLWRLNHRKYMGQVREAYAEHIAHGTPLAWIRCVCTKSTALYVVVNLAVALVWFVLMVIYPIVGVAHAVFEVARRTYDESDMWEESLEGGLQSLVAVKSDKERCAEALAKMCIMRPVWGGGDVHVCRIVLYFGDALLLTGVVEGLRRVVAVYDLHTKLLELVDGLLDTVNDADEVQSHIPRVDIRMPVIELPKLPMLDLPAISLPKIELELPLGPVLRQLPSAAIKVISEVCAAATRATLVHPPCTAQRPACYPPRVLPTTRLNTVYCSTASVLPTTRATHHALERRACSVSRESSTRKASVRLRSSREASGQALRLPRAPPQAGAPGRARRRRLWCRASRW